MPSDLIENGELILFGTVGADMFFDDSFSAREVVSALSELKGDITVRMNSWGGVVNDGVAIFNALKVHNGKVTIRVDGVAASAASVIAMAGDEIIVPENAMMMVHNASGLTIGPAADHRKQAEVLEKFDGQLADIYAARTKLSKDGVSLLMDEETWMTGREAVKKGFADSAPADASNDNEETATVDPRLLLYANAPDTLRQAVAAHAATPAAPKNRDDNVVNINSEMEDNMSDNEKAAAEAAAKAEAEAKVKADAEQKAKAEAEATEKAKKAADEAAATATAAATERATQIAAACTNAGVPDKIGEYLASDKSVENIQAELLESRAKADASEIASRITVSDEEAASGWDKAVNTVNSRL